MVQNGNTNKAWTQISFNFLLKVGDHLLKIINLLIQASNQVIKPPKIYYQRQLIKVQAKLKNMDLQILEILLKFPKKKQIKKLFEHSLVLINQQKLVSSNFSTPVIESLHQQVGLSSNEIHRLILSITSLFKMAAYLNFDEQRLNKILSQRLDEQLKQLVLGIVLSFSEQIKQIQNNRIRQGNHLNIENMDWNLATQIANEKGKSSTPVIQVTLPLQEYNKSYVQTIKFEMKGQQFEVFFNNLTKIKETLNDLVTQG